jgi:hypothetical protein
MTPRSQIIHALRALWLRSRERGEALKQAHYTCKKCGVKQSKRKGFEQKVEVHHKKGVGNWDKIVGMIYDELLCDTDELEVLCPVCHGQKTYEECVSSEAKRDELADQEAIQNLNDCEGR